jgi:hypothetical protein
MYGLFALVVREYTLGDWGTAMLLAGFAAMTVFESSSELAV